MIVDVVQLDASDDGDIATGGSRALALVEGGNPPTEYLMFGPGVNETVKGPLLFDDDAAALVVAFYESRGRKRLAGDWEHDSMVPSDQRPPEYRGSPASHWFDLEVRPGPELWATNVKWTPSAFAQIQRGEYAHTSPVVRFQKATGRITAVMSSALTNDPATIGQPQLVAASAAALSDFKESDHPRADDGKFGSGGGSHGSSDAEKPKEPNGAPAESQKSDPSKEPAGGAAPDKPAESKPAVPHDPTRAKSVITNQHGVGYTGKHGDKPYLAKIVGESDRYGLARDFVKPSSTERDNWRSSKHTLTHTYDVGEGLYEEKSGGDKSFIMVFQKPDGTTGKAKNVPEARVKKMAKLMTEGKSFEEARIATRETKAALSAGDNMEPSMGAVGTYKMADEHAANIKGIVDGAHKDEADMAGKLKACLSESFPAHFGGETDPAAAAKMSEDMGDTKPAVLDVDPSNLPQNAAVHIKTGNIHDEGGRKSSAISDEEKRQMTAWFNARGSLFREVAKLTGKKDAVEMVAVLTAMKHASEEVAALTAHAAKQSGAAFQSIVDKARSDKKLTPADCDGKTEAGKYVASLRDRGDEGIKALSAYVSALKPRVVTLDTSTKERETDRLDTRGEEVVSLNATEIETCRKNGIKQEDMLRVKKERVAELKANGIAPTRN